MTTIFADTAFYVAAVNPRDEWHSVAIGIASEYTGRVVTTEFVLVEVANFFSKAAKRAAFVDLLSDLQESADVEIVPASTELFGRAAELFAQRADKDWSLTDCASFVVMSDRGLTDAFTTDPHFKQAGFNVLMVESA